MTRPRLLGWLSLALLLALPACATSHSPRSDRRGSEAPSPAEQAPGAHDATARHSFEDVAHWSAVFDDPSRDAWQKPNQVVEALGVRPGNVVADLGAGTGYFASYLSRAVGPAGAVLAVDVEPKLVTHLRERAEKEGLGNLVPVLASLDHPRIPVGTVDLVLLVDTFHHIDDRVAYFRRVGRLLTPAGRVAIIDWKKEELPVGPPVEHKLTTDQVQAEMESAGYRLIGESDILPYQYFLIFSGAAAVGNSPPSLRRRR